jgi:hypothetical protein
MDDGVSDLDRDHVPGCDCTARRNVVSAEVVRFVASPCGDFVGLTDFPTIAFRLPADVGDGMSHKKPLRKPGTI